LKVAIGFPGMMVGLKKNFDPHFGPLWSAVEARLGAKEDLVPILYIDQFLQKSFPENF
jgi:hypothetical protein